MKKTIKYLIGVAIVLISLELLALLQSCTRIEPFTPPVEEDAEAIKFAPSIVSTKALLNADDLSKSRTLIQVYDFLTGFSGELDGHSDTIGTTDIVKYFSDKITYDPEHTSYWPYWSPTGSTGLGTTYGGPDLTIVYPWTKSGLHSFFGWIVRDGNTEPPTSAEQLFSGGSALSFNETTRVLTVPATTLTTSSPQFDFSYSDVTTVNAATRTANSIVTMQLMHFFGAIGITITNNSKNDVKVYSVQLKNFPNTGSGTLTFNTGKSPSVVAAYDNPVTVGSDRYAYWPNKITTPITLYNKDHATEANKVYDASNSSVLEDDAPPQFFLAWPMFYSKLEPTPTGVDADGIVTYTESSPLIEVKYGDMQSNASTAKTYTYRFPKVTNPETTGAIIAGTKYRLNLSFSDKNITVSFNQLPWNYDSFPMAYEGDAISTSQLKFVDDTYIDGGKFTDDNGKHQKIILKQSSPAGHYVAKGVFKAYTPINGLLTVSMSGNTEDFIVSLDSGRLLDVIGQGTETITIDPYRDDSNITLTVRPKGTPRSGSRIFLHFSVRNNGRDSDADTEINRDNYMITIE